jgi:hypothetical protein
LRSICVTVSTRSGAEQHSFILPRSPTPTPAATARNRLSRLQFRPRPSQHGQAVNHGGVRIRVHRRIRIHGNCGRPSAAASRQARRGAGGCWLVR